MKPQTYHIKGIPGEDFGTTVRNIKPLPEKYKYINRNIFARFFSFLAYHCIAVPACWLYLKFKYHQKIVGKKNMKKLDGCYIYANHTMVVGDVMVPNILSHKKNYIIIGEQAKSLTGILPLIRAAGGIPLPDSIKQAESMLSCIKELENKGKTITIYPEAHVWPYYTGIREYAPNNFTYPVMHKKPIIVVTNCYQKRKHSKTPKLVTFVDGPFYMDETLNKKQNEVMLRDKAYNTMKERTEKYSTYSFNTYIKEEC